MRIWNAALSQATIAAWKNSAVIASHPNFASLKAYYNFEEIAGTTVNDLSGNGNTGTLVNGATRVASTITFTPNYTYSWSPTAGLSNPNISNPIASVTTNTTYTVTVTSPAGCSSAASVNANVFTAIPAPTGTPSSQCGLANPAVSVSGGTVYNWYLAASGGTAIQSSASSTLTAYPISVTTTFYVAAFDGASGCESPRTAVVATVIQPDVVTATSNLNNVCPGTQLTLTATQTGSTNTYVFTWNGTPAGSGMTSGSTGIMSCDSRALGRSARGLHLARLAALPSPEPDRQTNRSTTPDKCSSRDFRESSGVCGPDLERSIPYDRSRHHIRLRPCQLGRFYGPRNCRPY